jgi:hypothetical protein
VEEVAKGGEEHQVTKRFPSVCRVVALVQSLLLELLVQCAVLQYDGRLRVDIARWVVSPALLPLALLLLDRILVTGVLLLLCGIQFRSLRRNQGRLLGNVCRLGG